MSVVFGVYRRDLQERETGPERVFPFPVLKGPDQRAG